MKTEKRETLGTNNLMIVEIATEKSLNIFQVIMRVPTNTIERNQFR